MSDDDVKEYSGKWWMREIRAAEKELDTAWRTSADKVVDRYLDRRDEDMSEALASSKKYNVFWSNVQILKSALYANAPKPTVARQNGDAKDDVARTAALILQRMLEIGITKDQSDMHNAFRSAVEDRLIPGLGQVWLRYDAKTEPFSMAGPDGLPIEGERIVSEEAVTDYVHWRDFLWSAARTWDEVWWVGRRVWMKKKKFIDRFGEDLYKEVKGNASTSAALSDTLPKGFRKGRVEVFEIWCEDDRKVYWVTDMLEDVLEIKEDLLGLDDFFPCPHPLLATHTTNTVVPRPDYVMAQDQYEELDTLNNRIYVLTKALRVVGVYDAQQSELAKMLSSGELSMIAVDNWAMLAEKGGLKGSVDWFPVEQVAAVLEKLMIQRREVINQIYELTSISDIMRGATNPRETAKAQTLKAQYSSVRLQLTQQDVSLFVRHALRLKAEIISKHFQPNTIAEQSQIANTESAAFAEQAIALIKQAGVAKYRIEISEESLSIADYNAEREMRIELATAVGQFLSQSAVMVKDMPQALPYLLRIIQWVVSAFRGSSDVEAVLDEAVKAAEQAPATPADAEQQKPDFSIQVAQIKAAADLKIADKDNAAKLQMKRMELQAQNEDKTLELAMTPDAPAEDPVDEEAIVDGVEKILTPLLKKMDDLLEASGKLKKRVPIKDAEGNILEVQEQFLS